MAKRKRPSWDAPPRKPRADSKLKNLPEEHQETLWLLMHPTDAETPPYTLEAVLVHLLEDHDITCSLSTLSEWHSWYALKLRTEKAMSRVSQAQQMLLEKNPETTEEELQKLGQLVFTAESIEGGNLKGFVALMRESSRRKVIGLDERRLEILERKAKAADEAAEQMKLLKAGGKMMPDEERAAILDKMDEILGLKK